MYIQNGVLAIISRIKSSLKFLNSMRIYVLLVFIVLGVLPLSIYTQVILNTYEEKAVSNKILEIQSQENSLANRLSTLGFLTTEKNDETYKEVSRVAEISNGRILVVSNNLNIVIDTYSVAEGRYLVAEEVLRCFYGENSSSKDRLNQNIEVIYPITNNDSKDVIGVIVMTCSTKNIYSVRNSLEQRAIAFAFILAILIVILAIYFSGKLTKPLTNVVSSIDRMTEGYMEEGLNIKGYNEIEKISDSFNHLITQMKKLESSRQEFVSNVSHELKTPITSIKVLADSLLAQKDVPTELYREFMLDITEEIERENIIITDLLSLVKLDKTAGDMHIVSININELLEQILKRLGPIAKKRNIELIYESYRPVIADVDEVKLSLAITNLIENAIKYNVEDGWVRVSLNADHKYFFIKVSDSGIGIPEDAQGFIFERFYRVDKARSRETGGTGLGLAITKNVIQMHHGAIKVYSKEGEGTTFNVRIPLNYIV
jgi:signal transduction histidine kinase